MAQKTFQLIFLFIMLIFPLSILSQSEPPEIYKISPEQITEGTHTTLTITGENFGPRDPTNRTFVSSGDNMKGPGLKIISWTSTQIEGTFPYFLQPGKYNIFILSAGVRSLPVQVEVVAIPAPRMTSIEPAVGIPESRIRVAGSYLGQSGDYRLVLRKFSAGEYRMVENLKVSSWYPTEIFAHISGTTVPGNYLLTLEKEGEILSKQKYTIIKPVPVIKNITPSEIFDGDDSLLTLSGEYFGESGRESMVIITEDTVSSKQFLSIRSWSDIEIQVTFPFNLEPKKYYLYVYTPKGGKSNYSPVNYLGKPAPKITRLTPWEGIPGSIIYIHGQQLGNEERYELMMWRIDDETETEKTTIESTSWTDTRIDFLLAEELVPGSYIIGIRERNGETFLTDFAFKVKPKPMTVNNE